MGAGGGFYSSIEDKWYGFIDSVSDKVPAFGGFIDALEDKGIPTLPAFIVLIIVIIAIAAYFLVFSAGSSLIVNVSDSQGNAISGATVTVSMGSEQKGNIITTDNGKAAFFLPNGDYTIKVDKDNYPTTTKSITLSADSSQDLILSTSDETITKAVQLKTADGQLITSSGTLTYQCKGTSDQLTAAYANGTFDATVKPDCQQVEVLSMQNYNIIASTASFAGNSAITVERQPTITGSVRVTLATADNNAAPPAGLHVQLVPNDGTNPIEEITTGTSILLFNDVPVKSYYLLVSDQSGAYATYDGSKFGEQKSVQKDTLTEFSASLQKAQSATITVNVKDATDDSPIRGASVQLTSTSNANDIQTQLTGATGTVQFMVATGATYSVSADQPDYLVGEAKPAGAGDVVEIDLAKVTDGTANSLLIHVIDADKYPVENARVVLKSSDATQPAVGDKTTGASGDAEFFNLELGKSYYATISKEGFGSVNSPSASIEPRSQKTLEVTFDIGKGDVLVKVLDSDKNPLSGATVKAINYYTSQQEGASITSGPDGIADFSIRADKKIYFIVETAGYEKYFTASVNPAASGSITKEVILQRPSGKLSAVLLGVYNGTAEVSSTGGSTGNVSQGVYTVSAILNVPKGSYSQAGLQLRTGKDTPNVTNQMEEDGLYLSSVESSGTITRGTTYTPPQGQDIDLKNTTSGSAKWANSVWRNPAEGTYEVEAEITVTEENQLVPLNLYYRGWTKGATTLRDPTGDATGQELYWPAKDRVLTAGASNLCSASFCKAYTLETLSGSEAGRKLFITSAVQAKKGISYALTADLTNYSGKPMSGAVLSVSGQSLDINSVMVNGTVAQEASSIALGTLGIDAPLKIVTVLNTPSSGDSAVHFTINSSTKTELDESVAFTVKPNRQFNLGLLPQVIVPYIDNTLFFSANDANTPLSGVVISIKSGNDTIGTITTTGEGLAEFTLPEPRIGDTLDIKAYKEGYDTVEVTKKVDSALLTITPPDISETLKIGDATGFSTTILMQNNTAKDIKVVSAQINGDVKGYADIKFDTSPAGTVILQGADKNYGLTIKLNSAAMRLAEPKDLTGTILITTEVNGKGGDFVSEIPLALRISMPGYLDNGKCLKITPTSVTFVASGNEQTQTITLSNQCTAENNSIALNDIEAELTAASTVGTITVSGEGFNNTQLSDKYTKVADYIEKDTDTQVTIHFNPNPAVASGTQTYSISFTGKNILNDATSEKVEARVAVNATTNYLTKCVQITQPSGGLLLDMAPWNLGYGALLGTNYGATLGSYAGFTNRNAPYNMSYMSGMSMGGYGSSGYGSGYSGMSPYGGAGVIAGGANTSYQQDSFTITNNCSTDIDVSLIPDSRITVNNQKFTLSKDSDETVTVAPGYVLGKYNIKVNAKATGSSEALKSLGTVSATVRKLGDIDTDCIKTNVTNISLDSFIYRPQTYSVYNYCYDTGSALARSNLATIECSAPKNQYDLGFLQVDQQSLYGSQFPITTQNPTYNSYIQSNGCQQNNCSLITGTRVRNRSLSAGQNGQIEQVDFEVMPSTQYIPQMKLFDNSRGSYGLFQNLSNIRQWGTETSARTNVYGNLNISYTNQYGSAQCIEFPITITDIWRMGESIDSAINWGDPNAMPKDCQNPDALNITQYWAHKTGAADASHVPVPSEEYKLGASKVYDFLAEPPALAIGPAPTQASANYPNYGQQYYWPQTASNFPGATYNQSGATYNASYYQNQANANGATGSVQPNGRGSGTATTAKKNCGLLDSIKVTTTIDPKETGGAIVTVSPLNSGSILNNTLGSNLAVEIDRSQMTVNCVHLHKPITAKVTRAINMQSEELNWTLDVIITRDGYIYPGNDADCMKTTATAATDCQAALKDFLVQNNVTAKTDDATLTVLLPKFFTAHPECSKYIDITAAQLLRNQMAAANPGTAAAAGCSEAPATYGFDKILSTKLDLAAIPDCTASYCNNDMLHAFLLNNFATAKSKLADLGNKNGLSGADTMVSKLYKQAPTAEVKICDAGSLKFYGKEDNTLGFAPYVIPKELISRDANTSISGMGANALTDMANVIAKIPAKDYNSILLEIDSNTSYDNELGMLATTKKGTEWYMALATYAEFIQTVLALNNANTATSMSLDGFAKCTTANGSISSNALRWMSTHSRLVKGIYDRTDMNELDIEKIYAGNPTLNTIHKLAKFSSTLATAKDAQSNLINSGLSNNLLLTAISDTKAGNPGGFMENVPSNLKDLTLDFKDKSGSGVASMQIGSYPIELDFNYYDLPNAKTATIITGENNTSLIAPKATQNPLLEAGYNAIEVAKYRPEHILDDSASGTLAAMSGNELLFYQRLPVKLSAELFGNEATFTYRPSTSTAIMPPTLINWYTSAGAKMGPDTKTGMGYTISVTPKAQAQTIRGLYYYPQGTGLLLTPGINGGRLVANATAVAIAQPKEGLIPTRTGGTTGFDIQPEIAPNNLTLDMVVKEVNSGDACPKPNNVVWNETKLIGTS